MGLGMAATGTEADVSPPLPRRNAKGLGYENQWALTWRKFTRHRLGVAGGVVVLLLYIVVLIPEFLAPMTLDDDNTKYAYAPPQAIKLGLSDEHGWHFEPHVDAYKAKVDYNSGKRLFADDPDTPIDVGLFVRWTRLISLAAAFSRALILSSSVAFSLSRCFRRACSSNFSAWSLRMVASAVPSGGRSAITLTICARTLG